MALDKRSFVTGITAMACWLVYKMIKIADMTDAINI